MSFDTFLIHDVTILEPGQATDTRGDTVEDWDNPVTTETSAWVSPPLTAEEQILAGRDANTITRRVRLPAQVTPSARARIVVFAETWAFDGQPHQAFTRRGAHHTSGEITIKKG